MGIVTLFHLDISKAFKTKTNDMVVLYGVDLEGKKIVQYSTNHRISLTIAVADMSKFLKLICNLPGCADQSVAVDSRAIETIHVSNIKVAATNYDFIDQLLNEPGTEMNQHLYLVKLDFLRYSDLYNCHKFLVDNKWNDCFLLPKYVHNLYQMISYDILFELTETVYRKPGFDQKFEVHEHLFHKTLLPTAAEFLIYQGCVVRFHPRSHRISPELNHECIDPEIYIPLVSFDIETISDNLLDLPQGMVASEKMVFFGIYSDYLGKKFCWLYYLTPDKNGACDHQAVELYLRREIEEAVAPDSMHFLRIRHFECEEDLMLALFELLSTDVGEPTEHISYTLTGGTIGWPYFLVCHNFLGYDLPFLMARHMVLSSKLQQDMQCFRWTPVGGHTNNRQETNMLIDTDNYRFDPYGLTLDSMYVFKRQGMQNISLAALTAAHLPKSQRKMSNFDVVSIRVPYILNDLPKTMLNGAKKHIDDLNAFLYPAFNNSNGTAAAAAAATESNTHVLNEANFPFLFKKFYPNSRKLAKTPKTTQVQPFHMGLVYQFWDVYSLHCLTKQSNMIGYCQNMAHYTQLPIDLAAVARVSCSIPRLIATFAMCRYAVYTDLLSNIHFKVNEWDAEGFCINASNGQQQQLQQQIQHVYPIFFKAMDQQLQLQAKKNQITGNDDSDSDDSADHHGGGGDDGDDEYSSSSKTNESGSRRRKINMSWYPGAVVLTKPGIYTNVHQFDWNSYYPSMCVTFNLAPDNVGLVRAGYLRSLILRLSVTGFVENVSAAASQPNFAVTVVDDDDQDDDNDNYHNYNNNSEEKLKSQLDPILRNKLCDHILKFYLHCYVAEENIGLHLDHDRETGYYHYLNNHKHQVGRLVHDWTDLIQMAEKTPNMPLMIRSLDRYSSWPVPDMLRQFMSDRGEMKRELKIPGVAQAKPYLKAREKAVKILINSTYGVFKFFAKMIGPSITLYCRKILIHMCRIAPVLYLCYLRERGNLFGQTRETKHLIDTDLDGYLNYVRLLSPFTHQQHLEWKTTANYSTQLHEYSMARIIDADTDSFQIISDPEDLHFSADYFAKNYLNTEMVRYTGGEWGAALKLEPLSEKERHHLLILLKKKRYIGLETRIDPVNMSPESFSLFPTSPFSYKRVNIGKNAIAPIKHILAYTLDTLVLYHYFFSSGDDAPHHLDTMKECFAQNNFYFSCFEYLHHDVDREQLSYPIALNRISTNTPRKHYIDSVTSEYGGGRTMDTYFVFDESPQNKYHFTFVTKKAYLDRNLKDGGGGTTTTSNVVGNSSNNNNNSCRSSEQIYFPEYLKNYIKIINDVVNAVLNINVKYKIDELHATYMEWMMKIVAAAPSTTSSTGGAGYQRSSHTGLLFISPKHYLLSNK